ncbi:DUF6170 family protein [Planctobacterium marinum]|uniref:Transmembrane protein n=1 Tax=Planctobacterium marinum TaxID=1631968 RepID=A0AA48KVN5_9ALTE|nr:hypothetical protein MACH26_32210 [Planctobacterium marinum]
MKFYFTHRSIPELANLSLEERLRALQEANQKLTPPERLLLNLLKLLVLVPVFALLLRSGEDWTVLGWAALVVLIYPLIVRPIQFNMSRKYLK